MSVSNTQILHHKQRYVCTAVKASKQIWTRTGSRRFCHQSETEKVCQIQLQR